MCGWSGTTCLTRGSTASLIERSAHNNRLAGHHPLRQHELSHELLRATLPHAPSHHHRQGLAPCRLRLRLRVHAAEGPVALRRCAGYAHITIILPFRAPPSPSQQRGNPHPARAEILPSLPRTSAIRACGSGGSECDGGWTPFPHTSRHAVCVSFRTTCLVSNAGKSLLGQLKGRVGEGTSSH